MVLKLNGFDSFLALKGMHWEDKNDFFIALDESIANLLYTDDNDETKRSFIEELSRQNQSLESFKLKLGHKNLILNLCYEMMPLTLDEFNNSKIATAKTIIPTNESTLIVRKTEHEYSKADDEELTAEEYHLFEDAEDSQHVVEEIIDYPYGDVQYVQDDDSDGQFIFETKYNNNVPTRKKPKLDKDDSDRFVRKEKVIRRRPKILKKYPDGDEGKMLRWIDLVKQSIQCTIPAEVLEQVDYENIDIVKVNDSTWEIRCPLCDKKLRLQITQEGKYINYKRSNFERHLRTIHNREGEELLGCSVGMEIKDEY